MQHDPSRLHLRFSIFVVTGLRFTVILLSTEKQMEEFISPDDSSTAVMLILCNMLLADHPTNSATAVIEFIHSFIP
jgi:hypothetical protein